MELPPFLTPLIVWDRDGATWSIVHEETVMTATTVSAPVFLETAATPPYLVSALPSVYPPISSLISQSEVFDSSLPPSGATSITCFVVPAVAKPSR